MPIHACTHVPYVPSNVLFKSNLKTEQKRKSDTDFALKIDVIFYSPTFVVPLTTAVNSSLNDDGILAICVPLNYYPQSGIVLFGDSHVIFLVHPQWDRTSSRCWYLIVCLLGNLFQPQNETSKFSPEVASNLAAYLHNTRLRDPHHPNRANSTLYIYHSTLTGPLKATLVHLR